MRSDDKDTTKKKKRLRVGVVFGGRSGEHEVSLMSAASVIDALDPEKYEIIKIGITKSGRWITGDVTHRSLVKTTPNFQVPVNSGLFSFAQEGNDIVSDAHSQVEHIQFLHWAVAEVYYPFRL